jgi:hypothetical protein
MQKASVIATVSVGTNRETVPATPAAYGRTAKVAPLLGRREKVK